MTKTRHISHETHGDILSVLITNATTKDVLQISIVYDPKKPGEVWVNERRVIL